MRGWAYDTRLSLSRARVNRCIRCGHILHDARIKAATVFCTMQPKDSRTTWKTQIAPNELYWAIRGAAVQVHWAAVLWYPMVEDMLKYMEEFAFFPH